MFEDVTKIERLMHELTQAFKKIDENKEYILNLEKRFMQLQKECNEHEKRWIEAQESGQKYRDEVHRLRAKYEALK